MITDSAVFLLNEEQRNRGDTPQCHINGTLCGGGGIGRWYWDIHSIRAGIADSLEASEFTSIRERLLAAAAQAATIEAAAEVRGEGGTKPGLGAQAG